MTNQSKPNCFKRINSVITFFLVFGLALQPVQKQNLQTNNIHLAPHSGINFSPLAEHTFNQELQKSLVVEQTLLKKFKGIFQLYPKTSLLTPIAKALKNFFKPNPTALPEKQPSSKQDELPNVNLSHEQMMSAYNKAATEEEAKQDELPFVKQWRENKKDDKEDLDKAERFFMMLGGVVIMLAIVSYVNSELILKRAEKLDKEIKEAQEKVKAIEEEIKQETKKEEKESKNYLLERMKAFQKEKEKNEEEMEKAFLEKIEKENKESLEKIKALQEEAEKNEKKLKKEIKELQEKTKQEAKKEEKVEKPKKEIEVLSDYVALEKFWEEMVEKVLSDIQKMERQEDKSASFMTLILIFDVRKNQKFKEMNETQGKEKIEAAKWVAFTTLSLFYHFDDVKELIEEQPQWKEKLEKAKEVISQDKEEWMKLGRFIERHDLKLALKKYKQGKFSREFLIESYEHIFKEVENTKLSQLLERNPDLKEEILLLVSLKREYQMEKAKGVNDTVERIIFAQAGIESIQFILDHFELNEGQTKRLKAELKILNKKIPHYFIAKDELHRLYKGMLYTTGEERIQRAEKIIQYAKVMLKAYKNSFKNDKVTRREIKNSIKWCEEKIESVKNGSAIKLTDFAEDQKLLAADYSGMLAAEKNKDRNKIFELSQKVLERSRLMIANYQKITTQESDEIKRIKNIASNLYVKEEDLREKEKREKELTTYEQDFVRLFKQYDEMVRATGETKVALAEKVHELAQAILERYKSELGVAGKQQIEALMKLLEENYFALSPLLLLAPFALNISALSTFVLVGTLVVAAVLTTAFILKNAQKLKSIPALVRTLLLAAILGAAVFCSGGCATGSVNDYGLMTPLEFENLMSHPEKLTDQEFEKRIHYMARHEEVSISSNWDGTPDPDSLYILDSMEIDPSTLTSHQIDLMIPILIKALEDPRVKVSKNRVEAFSKRDSYSMPSPSLEEKIIMLLQDLGRKKGMQPLLPKIAAQIVNEKTALDFYLLRSDFNFEEWSGMEDSNGPFNQALEVAVNRAIEKFKLVDGNALSNERYLKWEKLYEIPKLTTGMMTTISELDRAVQWIYELGNLPVAEKALPLLRKLYQELKELPHKKETINAYGGEYRVSPFPPGTIMTMRDDNEICLSLIWSQVGLTIEKIERAQQNRKEISMGVVHEVSPEATEVLSLIKLSQKASKYKNRKLFLDTIRRLGEKGRVAKQAIELLKEFLNAAFTYQFEEEILDALKKIERSQPLSQQSSPPQKVEKKAEVVKEKSTTTVAKSDQTNTPTVKESLSAKNAESSAQSNMASGYDSLPAFDSRTAFPGPSDYFQTINLNEEFKNPDKNRKLDSLRNMLRVSKMGLSEHQLIFTELEKMGPEAMRFAAPELFAELKAGLVYPNLNYYLWAVHGGISTESLIELLKNSRKQKSREVLFHILQQIGPQAMKRAKPELLDDLQEGIVHSELDYRLWTSTEDDENGPLHEYVKSIKKAEAVSKNKTIKVAKLDVKKEEKPSLDNGTVILKHSSLETTASKQVDVIATAVVTEQKELVEKQSRDNGTVFLDRNGKPLESIKKSKKEVVLKRSEKAMPQQSRDNGTRYLNISGQIVQPGTEGFFVAIALFLGSILTTLTFNRQQKEKEHREGFKRAEPALLRRKSTMKAVQPQPFMSLGSQLTEMAL